MAKGNQPRSANLNLDPSPPERCGATHTLRDLQLDTSKGWAALPLAVRMPTCSSPPCAPDMKRQQALSSPSEKWDAVHVSGCQPVESVVLATWFPV